MKKPPVYTNADKEIGNGDAGVLFSPPAQRHSETSKKAAESVAHLSATQRENVLIYLRQVGPATDETIQIELGMNPSTERPRRVELVNLGLVRDSGRRARTASGRTAVVWEAVKAKNPDRCPVCPACDGKNPGCRWSYDGVTCYDDAHGMKGGDRA